MGRGERAEARVAALWRGGALNVRCLLLGRWAVNPYQKLLTAHLTRLGVEVVERDLEVRTLPAALRKCRPDVLHLQSIHPSLTAGGWVRSLLRVVCFLAVLIVARLRGIRIVWTVHDLEHHDRVHPLLDRVLTRLTMRIAHARITHCAVAGVPDAVVIPHGNYIGCYENRVTRAEARRALGIEEQEFVFLFLGWVRPYKGVQELIDAFQQLDAGRLIIAGEARPAAFGELLERRASGNPRISIHAERIPDDRLQHYFNACDVVVLPYRHVLTSGAAMLAMSFARPCIAPRIGCMEEMLDGALLYEPGGLLAALKRAMEAPDLARMGERNYARAAGWGWEDVAGSLVGVYWRPD